MTFRARLPADRKSVGDFALVDDEGLVQWGPVPCLAKADQLGAQAHQNPTRNPEYPYGDHPLGRYLITGWAPTGADAAERAAYGPAGKLVLDPLSGQALTAKLNGRYGLLIHGGKTSGGGPYPRGLRPTYGCLSLLNDDMMDAVEQWRTLIIGSRAFRVPYEAVLLPERR